MWVQQSETSARWGSEVTARDRVATCQHHAQSRSVKQECKESHGWKPRGTEEGPRCPGQHLNYKIKLEFSNFLRPSEKK